MNLIALSLIFVAAVYVMVNYGIARTFVFVYIPALLLLFLIPAYKLPGIPNLNMPTAVGYAVLLIAPFKWKELSRLKFNAIDIMIVLMMLPPTISVLLNDTLWDAIGRSGDLFFRWILPYFLARIAFNDADARKRLLPVLCTCAIVIGCFAAIEARLRPYFVARTMKQAGLANAPVAQVFWRFGLARAQTTLGHPIDLGVCGTIVGSMIILLTPITGRRWNDKLPLAGVFACGAMVVGAVSFTGFLGMATAFASLYVFTRPRLGPNMVLPAMLGVGVLVATLMASMLTSALPAERPEDKLEESLWIRQKIVQEGWETASSAGLLGKGLSLDTADIGTGSIDNSYLLFVMQYGWLYLASWVLLAMIVGYYGGRTLALTQTPSERIPVAAACAGIVAVLLAMYTVFYGFAYALLFLSLLGMLSSMWQIFSTRGQPIAMPAGYQPAMPPGMMPGGTR